MADNVEDSARATRTMPTLRRTIRLFVSSTFSDMKAERDGLQDDVFPRLRQLCLSNGLRFQPIDLRWGVPEEAGKDNRTMRICLRELKRCQEERPKPNFLILLGDRYGWRPLPEIIPANVFAQLRNGLPAAMQELFEWRETQPAEAKGWYRRDDNAVPPVYALRPRGDDEEWHETVERPLLRALEAAARQIGLDVETHGVAISTSATEQEIVEGSLKVDDAREHVHAFFRSIDGLPDDPWPQDFVDVSNDRTRDSVAAARLDDLKTHIQAKLGASNVHRYTVPWHDGGVQTTDLTQFGQDVFTVLRDVILEQIGQLTSTTRDAQEEEAHRVFGEERCRGFIGRTEPLEQIAACLQGRDRGVLAVVGPAGSGKSAVMAEAVRRARETYGKDAVLARFIGATPDSANLLSLLGNLVAEIRRRYPAPPPAPGEKSKDAEIPVEINPLTAAFHEALARPTAERPLFVFLDALDQLAPGDGAWELRWLPGALNPHVRLILSAALPAATDAVPEEDTAGSPQALLTALDPRAVVMAELERRVSEVEQIRLQPLSAADGRTLVAHWLGDAGRTLQPAQEEAILASFAPEGNPLWLRVAIGQSQRLASGDSAPDFDPGLPDLMRQVLDRLSAEDEHGAVLVERALAALASGRHGLAEDEVMDVLSADQEVMADFRRRSPKSPRHDTLPVAVWVRLHGDIAPYLTEHQLQNAALLGFYHRSFLEAVQAAFLGTRDRQRATHQRLADYFSARTWFIAPVDEEGRAQRAEALTDPPDVRKASELPWQMLRVANASDPAREQSAAWDAPAAVLCDIEFLEAKCRAGLVFELQEDYRDTRNALPEAQMIFREEQRRTADIARWTDEIIRHSQAWRERRERIARGESADEAEPVLPAAPACRMWTNQEIEAECRRIAEAPTRLDRLAAFAGFVQGECYPLVYFGGREGFGLQHAINYAPGGPVHDAAHELLPRCDAPLLLRRWPKEATWNPNPAMLRTLEGQSWYVTAVALTPDGGLAVSPSSKGLKVWDLQSGQTVRTLEGHSGSVNAVAVTPDGAHAISASYDWTLKVWNLKSGQMMRTLEGHSSAVMAVAVTPDYRAVSASSGDLKVWDLQSGQVVRSLEGPLGVEAIAVTLDGGRAITASHYDRTVTVWDLQSGQVVRTLEGHKDYIKAVALTVDGRQAISASDDETLRVWDLKTGRAVRTLEGHSGPVFAVAVTADGRQAISASYDKTLRVWDLQSGRAVRSLEGHSQGVSAVAMFEPEEGEGGQAISASYDGTLKMWDLKSGQVVRSLEVYPGDSVRGLAVTRNGERAVSASWHDFDVEDPRYDGGIAILTAWDLRSGKVVQALEGDSTTREEYTYTIDAVALKPDGEQVISGSQDQTLTVWDLKSRKAMQTLEGHRQPVNAVAVSPDGGQAISASSDRTVKVWDLQSGRTVQTLEGHRESVNAVAVTPDGGQAISASSDRTVKVWDLKSGKAVRTLEGHSESVNAVAVTPDGGRAVSGSDDNTVRVWDLESGACLVVFVASAPVRAVAVLSGLLTIGTGAGQVLFVEMRNLPHGPAIAPNTRRRST